MSNNGRRVVVNISLSIDGYYHGPAGPQDMGFVMPHAITDVARDHLTGLWEPATTALLGRNNAVGIVFASLLWAYLDAQANGLQINAGVSDRLVLVIQGVIVLSVVIAYEIVRRAGVRMEQRRVASQLAAAQTPVPEKEGAAA